MKLFQIEGFHRVNGADGTSRMPGVAEDGLYPYWDNDLGYFVYKCIKGSDDETFVDNVTFVDGVMTVHRNDDVQWVIDLGDHFDLQLPGDTMILFDENNTIGGRSNLTYNYTSHQVILTDTQGLYAKVTGIDSANVNVLQYLGNHNLFLDYGTYKTPSSNMEHNIAIGNLALSEIQEGDENVAIGKYAGAAAERTTNRNVYLGAYAGRMNTEDDRLYVGNTDYASLAEFKENSLLYGEFDNGILYVNNRLDLGEEIRIGTFNVANTPLGGMVQFVDADGTHLKPQYYDNTQWVDFANGVDSYLTNVTYDGANITFEVNGQPDIVLPFEDLHLTVAGNLYDVQLNNGSGDLAASDNFAFNTVTNTLLLNGILNLTPVDVTSFAENEGNILYDGEHFYGYTPDGYVQLDNEDIPASGKFSIGESIGSGVEIYAGYSTPHKALQFYDIIGGDHIDIADADAFGNIYISLDALFEGVNLGVVGQPIFDSVLDTATTITYNFKRLYSSDSSILITDAGNYLNLQAVGAVAPEDLSDGENVGAGEGRVYDELNGKNGNLIPFRTIKQGTNITVVTDTVNKIITIDSDALVVTGANITGGDQGVYKDYTDDGSGNRTLNFKPLEGIDGINITLNGDVIQIGLDATYAIPALEGVILPVATDANKTLTWSLNYDSDIRDGIAYSLEDIVQLKLGSNLTYNPVTNVLDSIAGSTGGYISLVEADIVRNGDGTVDRASSTRTVTFTEGTNNYSWVYAPTTGLGWLAFENDYPVASDTQQGIVEIDVTGPLSITNGILSFEGSFSPADPNYSIQYNNNGVFGGSSAMIYDPINDRIYLDAGTAATSGIVFDSALGGNEIYNEKTGVTGDHLFIKGDASTLSSVQLIANKLAIGVEDRNSDNYMTIQDPSLQAKANTLMVNAWDGNNTLRVDNSGNIYLPKLALQTETYVVSYNATTKKISYAPASAVAGIATIKANADSGIALNDVVDLLDHTSSLSTTIFDQNDNRLDVGAIEDGDYIGFWNTSANKQNKVLISDFRLQLGGWFLDVEGVEQDEVLIGDRIDVVATGITDVSFVGGILTINSRSDITTSNLSGLTVNDGDSAVGTTKDLKQNDNRLTVATISDGDWIGFYDISTGLQSKTTLANFKTDMGGWILQVEGSQKDEVVVGDIVNITATGIADASYVGGAVQINATKNILTPATSGLTADSGDSSSAINTTLQLRDDRLSEAIITDASWIGFYTDGVGQRKTTLSNLNQALGGWSIHVNDVAKEEILLGDFLNIKGTNLANITYDAATNTVLIDVQGEGLTVSSDMSITGIGTPATPVKLVNDVDAPGQKYYYGTDSNGTKGWIPFCDSVAACVDDDPTIVVPPVDPNTGNVNMQVSRDGCETSYNLTASMFVDTVINLTNIRIDTIPAVGTLKYNGDTVTAGQILNVSIGNFQYTLEYVTDTSTGSAYNDTFTFSTKYSTNSTYSTASATVNVSVDACITYGVCLGYLYNFYAVTDARKITSSDDWIVPASTDFITLQTYLGGQTVAGGKMKLTGELLWTGNVGATNEVGFNGIGGGVRPSVYNQIKNTGWFITTTGNGSDYIAGILYATTTSFNVSNYSYNYYEGMSVRLVRAATSEEQLLADGTALANYVGNDGKEYTTVKIGTQVWTSENLEETQYRTLDYIIHEGANEGYMTSTEWVAATYGAWAIYDDDVSYSCHYVVPENEIRGIGLLYNLAARSDTRLITSSDDWIIPSATIWDSLITYIGGNSFGNTLKAVGEIFWTGNTNGTDLYGFKGVGGGERDENAVYQNIKIYGNYASTDDYCYVLNAVTSTIVKSSFGGLNDDRTGISVRLVKSASGIADGTILSGGYTGNDGRIYDAIAINEYYWLIQNLEETKFRNNDDILYMYEDYPWVTQSWDDKNYPLCTIYNGDPNNLSFGNAPTPFTGTPYDFSMVMAVDQFDYSSDATYVYDIEWKPDGTKFYATVRNLSSQYYLFEYTAITPWVTAGSTKTAEYALASNGVVIRFKADGSKMWITFGGTSGTLSQFSLSTAWDITSTVILDGTISRMDVVNGFGADYGFIGWCGASFNSDGTKIIGMHVNSILDRIFVINLGTAFDITGTKTYVDWWEVPSVFRFGYAKGIEFITPTKYGLVFGNQVSYPDYRINIIETDTDYDFTNVTHTNFITDHISGYGYGIRFNSDGSKVYFATYNGDADIFTLTLSL